MLTVKTIIDGVMRIREQESITIARRCSSAFTNVLDQTNNTSNPDFAITLPAVYEDLQCTKVLQEEELIISERAGVLDVDAIAILIEEFESPISAKRKAFGGVRYQYLYPGDQVYVMDSHGSTIATVI